MLRPQDGCFAAAALHIVPSGINLSNTELFTVFMVVGRLICGVHWFTDILGGLIFSIAVILLYCSVNNYIDLQKVKLKKSIKKQQEL